MPDPFRWHLSTAIIGGIGLLAQLPAELARRRFGRVLLVADPGVAAAGLLEPVTAVLAGSRVEVAGIWTGVTPDAEAGAVMAGAEAVAAAGADSLLAVGGGSAIDTAKLINLARTLGGHILEHVGTRPRGPMALKVACIPTTAGTGSEVSVAALVKDERRGIKHVVTGAHLCPDLALLVPELTYRLPGHLTSATGFDALSHGIEAYLAARRNPLADAVALECIRQVRRHLPGALERPEDPEHRYGMLTAATLGGMAFSCAGLGLVHAISHALGARCRVHHGTANAVLLAPVMAYNLPAAVERLAEVGRALGVTAAEGLAAAEAAIAAVERLRAECGLPADLGGLGVTRAQIPELAELALADPTCGTNPMPVSADAVAALLGRVIPNS